MQMKCGGICQEEITYLSNSLSNQGVYSKLSLLEELERDEIISEEEKDKIAKKLAYS